MKYERTKMTWRGAAWMGVALISLFLSQGASAGEVLKATPNHVEFGTINEGENAVATVEIENIGDVPVEITNVRTS
jgi:hypothetical protein